MSIKLPKNLGNIPRTSDDEVPTGFYLAKIIGVKFSDYIDKDGNKVDIAKVQFEIIQPPEYQSMKISDSFFVKEKTLWRIAQFLDAVFGRVVQIDVFPDAEQLANKEVVFMVSENSYSNSFSSTRISRYFPAIKWEIYKGMEVKTNTNTNNNDQSNKNEEESEDIPF